MRAGAATWARTKNRRRGAGKIRNFFKKRFEDFKSFLLPVVKKHAEKLKNDSINYAINNKADLISTFRNKGVSGLKDKIMTDAGPVFSNIVDKVTRGSGVYATSNDLFQDSRDRISGQITIIPTTARFWQPPLAQNPQSFPWFQRMPVQAFVDNAMANCYHGLSDHEKRDFINKCYDHDLESVRGGILPFVIPIGAAWLGSTLAKIAAASAIAAPVMAKVGAATAAAAPAIAKGIIGTAAGVAAGKIADKIAASRGSGLFYAPAGIVNASTGSTRGAGSFGKINEFGFGKRHTTNYPNRLEIKLGGKGRSKVIYVSDSMYQAIMN